MCIYFDTFTLYYQKKIPSKISLFYSVILKNDIKLLYLYYLYNPNAFEVDVLSSSNTSGFSDNCTSYEGIICLILCFHSGNCSGKLFSNNCNITCTAVEAPGEAPSKADIEPSSLVTSSVPN